MTDQMNSEKLTNTILYLLRGCGAKKPGLTALLKMLWFADSEHYRRYLRPITGGRYLAYERGPVLEDYTKLLRKLETTGALKKTNVTVHGAPKPKAEYVAKQVPNDAALQDSEREILNEVITHCAGLSGTALSELTHQPGAPWIFAWDANEPGRHIPYALVRWMDNTPDESDVALAMQALGRKHVVAEIKELTKGKEATRKAATPRPAPKAAAAA